MSIENLKKALKEEKLIYGKDETLKKIKSGKVSEVFLSSNCPKELKEDILHYSKIANIKVDQLDVPNDELGIICKKPFSISVACY
ncbi:MAG TPA: ribosomal L7Ae/L30e/S12e/Gadd45 family protein [Candidatus Nanoarchaeia archaeon]|nr:ribosomal L7Ae/L30e/S12e/Gadd45 family protein [Candidatus Nanoarchaeia archaeon]